MPIDSGALCQQGDIYSSFIEILFTYSAQAKHKRRKAPGQSQPIQDSLLALGPAAADLYIVDAPRFLSETEKNVEVQH